MTNRIARSHSFYTLCLVPMSISIVPAGHCQIPRSISLYVQTAHVPQNELAFIKKLGYLIRYLCVLLREIVTIVSVPIILIATILSAVFGPFIARTRHIKTMTARIIGSTVSTIEKHFEHDMSKFLLANSITLTPGTITVSVENP